MDKGTTTETDYIVQITTGIHRLSSVMGRLADGVTQNCCGLGMAQFRILWVLHTHEEGVQQASIAKWLNITEAAISRQLQVLKDGGLLSITVDKEDRRSRTVHLTPSGRSFTQNGLRELSKATAPLFKPISKSEQKQMAELLDTLFYRVVDKLK